MQAREFEPLGSNRTLKVEVRIIAATNRDLEKMVREGRWDDLYYRLNVFPVVMPPLRKRLDDLPVLAESSSRNTARRTDGKLSPGARGARGVPALPLAGNIREMENVIERGVIVCQGDVLTLEDLPPALQRPGEWPAAVARRSRDCRNWNDN